MPARRTHTKTRTGCDNCKKRHIKCDGLGPPCANCQVRELECTRLSSNAAIENSTKSNSELQTSWLNASSAVTTGSRLLELELMYRWSTETCHNVVPAPIDDYTIWQKVVSEDALQNDFLLNAVFAITSLHIAATTEQSRSNAYQVAALEYHNRAIMAFQGDQRSLKVDNHQAVFAFSVINLVLAVALPHYSPQGENKSSVFENLVILFRLLKGVLSIVASSRTWLGSGPFQKLFRPLDEGRVTEDLDPSTKAAFRKLRDVSDATYVSVCTARLDSPLNALSSYEARTSAIAKLEKCFLHYEPLGCMRWLATIEQNFAQAMSDHEPVALLITMHWAILLHKLSTEIWWAKTSGKLLITELSMYLSPLKPDWQPAMAWIHETVGLPALFSGP